MIGLVIFAVIFMSSRMAMFMACRLYFRGITDLLETYVSGKCISMYQWYLLRKSIWHCMDSCHLDKNLDGISCNTWGFFSTVMNGVQSALWRIKSFGSRLLPSYKLGSPVADKRYLWDPVCWQIFLIQIKIWIYNYIHNFMWYVINHPCHSFSSGWNSRLDGYQYLIIGCECNYFSTSYNLDDCLINLR